MDTRELISLLEALVHLPRETEWVEFKINNGNPEEAGEYISALANSAALHRKELAYIVWGVENETHEIVGTSFRPRAARVGNEELESWLARLLSPRVDFRVYEFEHQLRSVSLIEVVPCLHTPVRFRDTSWIRVGSYKKKLRDFPEKERALWAQLSEIPFEKGIALDGVDDDGVLNRIDYPAFFDLLKLTLPADRDGILRRLEAEKIILPSEHGKRDITNLGAILFAKRLSDFEDLGRKAVRVIIYRGASRVETIKEQDGTKGYAVAFEGLITYINDQLPINEVIGPALRSEVRMFPEIAIRELVANAIIHQDFSATGDSPLVEIFSDRIEITNYGQPLINPDRFIDEPPQSRNERLASFMRRINVCEERGSGIDKVIFSVELYQLPAPSFQVTEHHTKVTLFAHRKLSAMDRKDRVRACYQHACLRYVSSQKMTNASLRKRLGIEEQNYAIASRIIAETIDANYIKVSDPESSSKKHASYIPFWA